MGRSFVEARFSFVLSFIRTACVTFEADEQHWFQQFETLSIKLALLSQPN